jgi:hypothetical protein
MKIWKKLSEKKVLSVFISEAHCEYKYQELLETALTAWDHAWSNKKNISTIYLEFDLWNQNFFIWNSISLKYVNKIKMHSSRE